MWTREQTHREEGHWGKAVLVTGVAFAILVVVSIGLGGTAAAETTATSAETIPEPLEDGLYPDVDLEAGETSEYDVELNQGEMYVAAVLHDDGHDIDVRILDPDGQDVGDSESLGDATTTQLPEAAAEGTYTVSIENNDEATTVDVEVLTIEPDETDPAPEGVPDPLESGAYETELEGGESVTYTADLVDGEQLLVGAAFDPADDISMTVLDPDGATAGDEFVDDSFVEIGVPPVEEGGDHEVVIENQGTDEATVGLEVYREVPGDTPPADERHDGDTIPDTLEDGLYSAVTVEEGTHSYEIDLTEDDAFGVATFYDTGEEIDLTVFDPAGNEVGEGIEDPGFTYVELPGVDSDGTYTVELENAGAETVIDFDVYHTPSDQAATDDVEDDAGAEGADDDDTTDDAADTDDAEGAEDDEGADDAEGAEEGGTGEDDADEIPGFGIVLALSALAIAVGVRRRAVPARENYSVSNRDASSRL